MAHKRFAHADGTPMSTDELLLLIARNDRRFRVAQSTFMLVVGLILSVVLIAQYNTLRQFQSQSEERRAGLETIQQATKDSVDEQKHYIYCIAKFFATSDRAGRVITDLDNCNISNISAAPTYSGEPSPLAPFNTLPDTGAESHNLPVTPTPTPTPTPPPTCRVRLPFFDPCIL